MPHSSGGGSHGGGSHSGSSHSSSSSSGSSGGSYSSGNSGEIFHKYKPFSHRYVYYGRSGRCHQIYVKGTPEPADLVTTIIVDLICGGIFLGIAWFLLTLGITIHRPLDTSTYNANVVVDDHISIVDTAAVETELIEFRDLTGVAPAVEIVSDAEWIANYRSLDTFAYSEYLRMFDDECHWLFVISLPEDYETAEFVDWKWEGMIGDDTERAIDYESEDEFTVIMHKHLLRSEPDTIGQAVIEAFDEFSQTAMVNHYSWGWISAGIAVAVLYFVIAALTIVDYFDKKGYETARYASVNAKEYNCEYCGNLYVEGTVTQCPHCGAPIPAHNK